MMRVLTTDDRGPGMGRRIAGTNSQSLTPAEIRVLREYLGLSEMALAAYLQVTDRTVRHWEAGQTTIPAAAQDLMIHLAARTAETVEAIVRSSPLMDRPRPVLLTFRSDAEFTAEHHLNEPGRPLPASWHRALCARVAHRIPDLSIEFIGDVPAEEIGMCEI